MSRQTHPVTRYALPPVRLLALVCGWALLAFTVATCLEIVLRKLGYSLQGIDEIGGYLMAVLSCAGFGYTLAHNAHTRIDLVLAALPRSIQAVLNVLAMVALAVLAAFAVWRGGAELWDSIDLKSVSTSPLQVPLWIPQSLWIAGLATFALVAAAYAIHALWLLVRSPRDVNRYYGPPSVQRELESELASLKQRRSQEGA
jgi:TRAP-type C4-dicarboxylate transport system permease small subunit